MIQQWDQVKLIPLNTLMDSRTLPNKSQKPDPEEPPSLVALITKSLSLSTNNCIFNLGLR